MLAAPSDRRCAHLGQILVIEDDRLLCSQLCRLLSHQGYLTRYCHDGESGLQVALSEPHDLVLLDVKLPGLNGFSLLRRLREQRQTPVIMLTASGAEEERIRGLRHGADDYLAKPFNMTELQLRIDAVLRRSRPHEPQRRETPQRLHADSLQLDRVSQQVRVAGQLVELTPIQFRLLWLLVEQRGEVLSKPYLYRSVLERDYSRYDRSLDMHISRIRRRLGEAGLAADQLQTLHGRGYQFL